MPTYRHTKTWNNKISMFSENNTTSVGSHSDIQNNLTVQTTPSCIECDGVLNLTHIYEERGRLVHDQCQTYKRTKPTDSALFRQLFVDDKYKFMYCPIAKIGNTAWRTVMLVLRGAIKSISDLEKGGEVYIKYHYRTLDEYSYYDQQERLHGEYTTFLFVRHPFSRLLSAFRDKFEDIPDMSRLRKYSPIVKKATGRRDSSLTIKFEEFVRYLLKTDPSTYDIHWLPMHIACHLCFLEYDVIGKYETFAKDTDYVMKLINADGVLSFPYYAPHATNSSSDDVIKQYYNRLTKTEIQKLYKIYEWDFKLFGYEIPHDLGL
ncbi:carbohydrate sulfotransferase 11-like [Glandiceps talaboti]